MTKLLDVYFGDRTRICAKTESTWKRFNVRATADVRRGFSLWFWDRKLQADGKARMVGFGTFWTTLDTRGPQFTVSAVCGSIDEGCGPKPFIRIPLSRTFAR